MDQALTQIESGKNDMNMKSNLAQEPPTPQGELVWFPKKERQVMSKKEEGFTRMPNSLIDDQIMAQLNDKAFKCLMFIVRQTSGFDRTSHTIAITQFQKYCGIKKRDTVMMCIKDLEEKNLVQVIRKTGCLNEYVIPANQYQQVVLPSNGTSTFKGDGTSTAKQDGTSTVERGTIKETFKENIKQINIQGSASKNSVDEILDLWKPNLESLNAWLQRAGEMAMTQELVNQVLLEVNAHYELKITSGQLTDAQMYSNFVKWIKRKFVQRPKTSSQKQTQPATNSRNVNEKWGQEQQYAKATGEVDIGDFV